MTEQRQFIISTPEAGIAAGIVKIKVASTAVEDAYTILQLELAPQAGAPLHIHHREDEIFHVIAGSCTVYLGDKAEEIAAGTIAILPKGQAHAFQNNGDEIAVILITAVPGGLDRYFQELAAIDTEQATDIEPLVATINAKYEIEFLAD